MLIVAPVVVTLEVTVKKIINIQISFEKYNALKKSDAQPVASPTPNSLDLIPLEKGTFIRVSIIRAGAFYVNLVWCSKDCHGQKAHWSITPSITKNSKWWELSKCFLKSHDTLLLKKRNSGNF